MKTKMRAKCRNVWQMRINWIDIPLVIERRRRSRVQDNSRRLFGLHCLETVSKTPNLKDLSLFCFTDCIFTGLGFSDWSCHFIPEISATGENKTVQSINGRWVSLFSCPSPTPMNSVTSNFDTSNSNHGGEGEGGVGRVVLSHGKCEFTVTDKSSYMWEWFLSTEFEWGFCNYWGIKLQGKR